MDEYTVAKTLTANDAGETCSHQAGLHIPKDKRILSFFPALDSSARNPRVFILFADDSGQMWEFAFIYYNNQFFGGTRNEYRLTRMTRFIRESGLASGDEVTLHRNAKGVYSISYRRATMPKAKEPGPRNLTLQLGSGWKIINI